MIYKLSNAADLDRIEEEFGLRFRYPKLYTPNPLINGTEETNLSVVTMQDKNEITFALWGLMPQEFREDWDIFQKHANTLNVQLQDLENVEWMKESFNQRRCLIIVSGFYTHLLQNGATKSYYLSRSDEKPFYLAGVYNVLEDGFQCSALITSKTNNFVSTYHDISNLAPIIIPKDKARDWLSQETNMEDIKRMVEDPMEVKLKAKPRSHAFFHNVLSKAHMGTQI